MPFGAAARSVAMSVWIGQVSRQLAYAVIADGETDRLLVPMIQWAIHRLDPGVEILEPEFRKRRGGVGEFLAAYRTGPMLILVHRDAEALTLDERLGEFDAVDRGDVIPVVPVRMSESWLLLDGTAIVRRAAASPRVLRSTEAATLLPERGRIAEHLPHEDARTEIQRSGWQAPLPADDRHRDGGRAGRGRPVTRRARRRRKGARRAATGRHRTWRSSVPGRSGCGRRSTCSGWVRGVTVVDAYGAGELAADLRRRDPRWPARRTETGPTGRSGRVGRGARSSAGSRGTRRGVTGCCPSFSSRPAT